MSRDDEMEDEKEEEVGQERNGGSNGGRDEGEKKDMGYSLWIYTQPRTVRLHKLPQDVLRRLVDIRSARILWEILFECDLGDETGSEGRFKRDQARLRGGGRETEAVP